VSGGGRTPDDDWFDALGGDASANGENDRSAALWVRAEYLRKSVHSELADAPSEDLIAHREAELKRLLASLEQKGYFANPPPSVKPTRFSACRPFFRWPRAGWLLAVSATIAGIAVILPDLPTIFAPLDSSQTMRGQATLQTRLVADPSAEAERLCATLRPITSTCATKYDSGRVILSARIIADANSVQMLHALELVSNPDGMLEVRFEKMAP